MTNVDRNFYVFITLMTKQSGIRLVGALIAEGMTVGPLSVTKKLMSGGDNSASFELALSVTVSSVESDSEKARQELFDKIETILEKLKISYYRRSIHEAHRCSWNIGNIEFDAPKDENGDGQKAPPEFTGLP